MVQPHQIRIIGGRWRGRRVRFPAIADVRPTPDRVRETLFNWLGQDLTGLRRFRAGHRWRWPSTVSPAWYVRLRRRATRSVRQPLRRIAPMR